jgi:transposase-like protein
LARDLAANLVAAFEADLPSAVRCVMDDVEACITHRRLPVSHRRATRTTNLLERRFVEARRRLKIVLNGLGKKAGLELIFGALIRAAERWRGLRFRAFETRQLAVLRKELDDAYAASIKSTAAASQPAFSSTPRP